MEWNYRISRRFAMLALAMAGVNVAHAADAGAEVEQPQADGTVKEAVSLQAREEKPVGVNLFGKRESLVTAQENKRQKIEIVDSVVADDINRLPDYTVADAIQRVTGVEIARDRGDGINVTLRGLTQVETLLNGREVFTAGSGRTLNYADIPSEMLAGIDVYKTASAGQLEGGIGGMVNLRTRRPFDFAGREVVGSARSTYGDLIRGSRPQFSLLASNRWESAGGEFGALINLSHQLRAFREDQKSAGGPTANANIIPGQTVVAPNGIVETVVQGEKERTGASLVLQWRRDRAELYAEAHYVEFKTSQNGYQLFITPAAGMPFAPGSAALFPGTSNLQSITWTNPSVSSWGSARDEIDRTTQLAVGGSWWASPSLKLKADVSQDFSYNNLFYSVLTLTGNAASASQNMGSIPPSDSVSGMNLLNSASFNTAGMIYASRPFEGRMTAVQLDGDYFYAKGWLDSLSGGVRYAHRAADDNPGQVVFASAQVQAGNAAPLLGAAPASSLAGAGGFIAGNPGSLRNVGAVQSALGISTAIPGSNPLGTWNISEDTLSGFAAGNFTAAKLDGNAGVRLVNTHEQVSGYQNNPAGGSVTPLAIDKSYLDALPSVNLRYALSDGFFMRGAASKSLTRPDFNQLSPSITLNGVQMTGVAGNPMLRPIRADNFDLALERYFNPVTSIAITGFVKRVDGFLATVSNPEVWGGQTYQVSRPQNTGKGNIEGFELGYQQFYDSLPGWGKGLGLQVNYTAVNSSAPSSIAGLSAPLQNLSKQSYNVIGMYEAGDISARIAYNWRDTFLSGMANIVGVGVLPIYTKGYGWLDASMKYRLDRSTTLAVEGRNLLNTLRSSYYGVESLPQTTWKNDREIGIGLTLRL